MIFQIKTINGQKTIVPLTADTGAGAPVGSLIAMYKKSSPSGYLYCDGSTFDETAYPALYQYLGSNVLPDYREFALVGAEENTTDVYNASTNPTGTIHDHDVYTEGQAKDDQLQNHSHNTDFSKSNNSSTQGGSNVLISNNASTEPTTGVLGARAGTVTRGKRKAVYFYIKATSGLTENQQENVLNTINENNSYSTEEHPTGKKWIDGKPIYSKVIENPANNVPFLSDVAEVVEYRLKRTYASENLNSFVYEDGNSSTNSVYLFLENGNLRIIAQSGGFTSVMKWVYVEYTKTV